MQLLRRPSAEGIVQVWLSYDGKVSTAARDFGPHSLLTVVRLRHYRDRGLCVKTVGTPDMNRKLNKGD
jgi:hypothetical protein